MPTLKITNKEIALLNDSEPLEFPKYVPQIINLANQNGQGTRPRVVGQLSEIFPEFLSKNQAPTIQQWEEWYTNKYPDALEKATDRIINQIDNLKEALPKIDRKTVYNWVKDLVINKTYNGMYYQKAIIQKIAELQNEPFRLANPEEEAQGIDGHIGKTPVQIKPITYNTMTRLNETINVKIIKYEVKKNHIEVQY